MSISDEDATLFREMTKGVRPLKKGNRIAQKGRPPAPPSQRATDDRTLPERWYNETIPPPELDPEQTVGAEESLFHVRDHLPHSTLQKLKKGSYCSGLELDLHGLTTVQAREELELLLQHAQHNRIRCIQLIHGKGNRSASTTPKLKSWANQWLRQRSEVLAFCSARQRDGGTGALYILLKN